MNFSVAQSFLGFLWGALYAAIIFKVCEAQATTLPEWTVEINRAPLSLTTFFAKVLFVVASAIFIVAFVHSFGRWALRLLALEGDIREGIEKDSGPSEERMSIARNSWIVFLDFVKPVVSFAFVIVLIFEGFLLTTYMVFRGSVNGYSLLSLGLMWPMWMTTVFMLAVRRLSNDAEDQTRAPNGDEKGGNDENKRG